MLGLNIMSRADQWKGVWLLYRFQTAPPVQGNNHLDLSMVGVRQEND